MLSCSENEVMSPADLDTSSDVMAKPDKTTIGNEAPSGAHYNLNIIGMSKEKEVDMTGNNGHRIFVKLDGRSKIMLIEGDDFAVLDANGTDGRAEFQLPDPDPTDSGISAYSIWVRALGKPGGNATITTCADADVDDITADGYVEVCSAENLYVESTKGPSKFKDVSRTLFTIKINADIYEDDVLIIKADRYTIFDDELEDYFWQYDNNGLKLLQMRFYPVPSDISDL